MRISLRRLREARSFDEITQVIKDIQNETRAKNDEVFISDLIVHEDNGGFFLLEKLRKDHNRKYYLKVLRDKWGRPVKPGDKVRRKIKEPLDRVPGTPIPSRVISASVKAGTWEDDFLSFDNFEVDEKGCIKCSADDVWYFLTHYGIHTYSREAISMHPHETSAGPQKVQSDGSMKHVHYRRFEEVETKEYSKLPSLEARQETVPKGK